MEQYGYFVNGVIHSGYLLKCSKCSKKIMVHMTINGANHNMGVRVWCGDCVLPLDEEFKTSQPETAAKIEGWLET